MKEETDRTMRTDVLEQNNIKRDGLKHSITTEIDRRSLLNEIPSKQYGFLEIIQSGYRPRHIELDEKELIIGRSAECDIQLWLDNVSRKHARIVYNNEEYQIEDLESTNGVYVNGVKVARCLLRNHDQIEIGAFKIIFNEEVIRGRP